MIEDDSRFQDLYQAARRAWPKIELPFELFRTHADQVGFTFSGVAETDAANGADLFLCCACGEGDAQAIAALEHQYIGAARLGLTRFDARPEFIDDVLQELRAKLLVPPDPRIRRYSGRGPLVAWIRVAASRTAIDLLRATREGVPREASELESLGRVDFGPEVQLLRAVYRDAFHEALARALAALAPKDRNMLRRHLVDHMTLEEIAGPYGVHPATVARRLTTLREQIATAVRDHLATRHRSEGGATSLESLAHAIRSEVYVSLGPLLAQSRGGVDEAREQQTIRGGIPNRNPDKLPGTPR
ncbi:MAG: sigma-70 family RNA polymerase sigma factor [Myxococcales bacterium]